LPIIRIIIRIIIIIIVIIIVIIIIITKTTIGKVIGYNRSVSLIIK